MKGAYYNEIDLYCAEWLRNLILFGHIAPGEVDTRSIEDVCPDDLKGFTQYHFFAGLGGWSYALRLAGWPDDRPIWTGSCPCQPFSQAGEGNGFADERHLWPAFYHLICERKPELVLGEQVASKDALDWFDLVSSDLEVEGYAVGANDISSAGVGAPHIRQRLFWVAESNSGPGGQGRAELRRRLDRSYEKSRSGLSSSMLGGLADSDGGHSGSEREQRSGKQRQQQEGSRTMLGVAHDDDAGREPSSEPRLHNTECDAEPRSETSGMGHHHHQGLEGWRMSGCERSGQRAVGSSSPTGGFWGDADWIWCRDGKYRLVEPGTFPLATGATNRVGRLRAYGNAVNAEAAKVFIQCVMDLRP